MTTVRRAEHKDAEGIQNVFRTTWLATYPNEKAGITTEDIEVKFADAYSDKTLARVREYIASLPENSHTLVAEDNGMIVGVCRIYIRETYNQLQAIYVLPVFQGKGIGTILWNRCLDIFDPNKDIIVQVATYNTHAISFYTNLGFQDTGKRFSEERHRMPVSHNLIPEMEMRIEKAL